LLLQQDLWKHVDAETSRSGSSTLGESSVDRGGSSYGVVVPASMLQTSSKSTSQQVG
jgi:hypothetical protein